MVNTTHIRQSNAQLNEKTTPRTCVFVGATSGIGKFTLVELVSLGHPIKAYVVGRKATEVAMKPLLDDLRQKNPHANLVWIEGEVSLLAEVQRICNIIKAAGDAGIDFMCLTTGYAPFSGRKETSDGLDITHALEYYSRMLFILQLLPLLQRSPNPRVLSVLAGSILSNRLITSDIHLREPSNFGGLSSQMQMSIMNTLFLDQLSTPPENEKISFIHNWPGAVETGNANRHHVPTWYSPYPITILFKPIGWIIGFSDQEAADRHLFIATTGKFGGEGPLGDGKKAQGTTGREGNGLFILNHKCDVSYSEKALKQLREKGQQEVWEETMKVLGPFLG